MTTSVLVSVSPKTNASLTMCLVPGKWSNIMSTLWAGAGNIMSSCLMWADSAGNVHSGVPVWSSVDTWSIDDALTSIEKIRMLEDNWDSEGSPAFTAQLLDHVSEIVKQLDPAPYVAPTGVDSILLEYYGEGDEYLSFDISADGNVQMLCSDANDEYVTETISVTDIQSMVSEFHERTKFSNK